MDNDLQSTEPAEYRILSSSAFRTCVLGDVERTVGFCVDSPGAAGYCDASMIWIADQITDPSRVIEVSVHECLHCIFPQLSEEDVKRYGEQIGAFIVGVFRAKGAGTIPPLKPLLTNKNVEKLFGQGARVRGKE